MAILTTHPLVGQQGAVLETKRTLIDFSQDVQLRWFVVNDGVMGGRSSSTLARGRGGTAVFEGVLSLENNGGFASVRAGLPTQALQGVTAILLRVRGDGKRYQLRLRPGRRMDGVAFASSFQTVADEWVTVELPISSFEPTFRGYRPRRAEPLDPAAVGQLGLMLTDKQEGPFRLELEWVRLLVESTSASGVY
jgi:hypothetical protein